MSRAWMVRDDKLGEPHRSDYYCAEKCHPVVVIDPEDREQVARLRDAIWGQPHRAVNILSNWQAALREFADRKPPKPAEPTGLGAVVEDDRGTRWVRTWRGSQIKNAWLGDLDGVDTYRTYGDIGAVLVLTEGVTS